MATIDEMIAALHAGGALAYFGPERTTNVLPGDFDEFGVLDPAEGEELALTGLKASIAYSQEQTPRKSQGRKSKSRTDVLEEKIVIKVTLLSIHKAAGHQLLSYLSGGQVTSALVSGKSCLKFGEHVGSDYVPFSVTLVARNLYQVEGGENPKFLALTLNAATAKGFAFDMDDEAFAEIEAEIESQIPAEEAMGLGRIYSL